MKLTAPAKINLYLHITGRREDGYHLLDSLFAFTEFGDEITITPSSSLTLTVDGPFAASLSDVDLENNLIFRAASLLKKHGCISDGAHIHLTKNIPVAAGLGGGSSDAAAILKGLNVFWGCKLDLKKLSRIGLQLGADVPACLYQKTAWVSGIGENIRPITLPFDLSVILLINPKLPLSTQAVFQQYYRSNASYSSPLDHKLFKMGDWPIFQSLLLQWQNDLEPSATLLLPEISNILIDLQQQPHCTLARMSGSGPTCFGLFPNLTSAKQAMQKLKAHHTNYWMMLTRIIW